MPFGGERDAGRYARAVPDGDGQPARLSRGGGTTRPDRGCDEGRGAQAPSALRRDPPAGNRRDRADASRRGRRGARVDSRPVTILTACAVTSIPWRAVQDNSVR